jgi:hypothetical protein
MIHDRYCFFCMRAGLYAMDARRRAELFAFGVARNFATGAARFFIPRVCKVFEDLCVAHDLFAWPMPKFAFSRSRLARNVQRGESECDFQHKMMILWKVRR